MYKIKRFHIYLVLAVAFLAHLTILHSIEIAGARPDLVLMCVVFFGIFLGPQAGVETGFVAGLMEDLFTFDFFGVNAFILAFTGLAVGIISDKLFRESRPTQFVLVFMAVCLSSSAHFFLFAIFSKNISINFSEYFFNSVMPEAIYTTAVSLLVITRFVDIFKLREQDEFL